MTSIIMMLMYIKYHVLNLLLDSQYQDFNISFKPVKPIKPIEYVLVSFYMYLRFCLQALVGCDYRLL